MKKWLFRRRAVQLGAMALLFLPLVMQNPFWFGTYLSSEFFSISLTDPLAALEVFLAGKSFYLPLFYSAIPLIFLGLVAGRLFCGWICPVNTILELLSSIRRPSAKSVVNTYTPYFILGLVLLGSFILSLPLFTTISPIGTVSRTIAFGVGIEFLLVAFIIMGEWILGEKAWCRLICPAGALYGLFGQKRILRPKLDNSSCVNCGQCQSICSMHVMPGSTQPLDIMNCNNCADCVDCCRHKAIEFGFAFNGNNSVKLTGKERT